jgi:hypothetical protein
VMCLRDAAGHAGRSAAQQKRKLGLHAFSVELARFLST